MRITEEQPGWFKSSHSDKDGECVEVNLDGEVGVRDTKDRDGGQLAVTAPTWTALLNQLR